MAFVGCLGPIVFMGGLGSANTFHSISKTNKESFVKHRVIQANDLVEDTGTDPIEITIEMHFHGPYTVAPSTGIAALEAVKDLKIPLPLIIGRIPLGRGMLTLFVIESVDTKMSTFVGSGLAVADASVKLLEYANPLGSTGPLSALGGALPGLSKIVGTLNNVAGFAGAIPGLGGVAGTVSGIAGQIGGGIGAVTGLAGAASNVFSSVTGGISSLSTITSNIQSAANALVPGGTVSVLAASASQVNGAIASLTAAGKAVAKTVGV
jgi:phage protein U